MLDVIEAGIIANKVVDKLKEFKKILILIKEEASHGNYEIELRSLPGNFRRRLENLGYEVSFRPIVKGTIVIISW